MSEAEGDNVTVSTDGITIRKAPDTEQFETLAVVFDITSDREDTVWLRVIDELPDEVSIDDVGFHPDYGAEFWDVVDDTVVFEREFNPVEEFTTVFGVRGYGDDNLEPFYADPEIEIINDAAEESGPNMDDVVSEEDSEMVREVIAGDRDTLPGMEVSADEAPQSEEQEPAEEPLDMPEIDPFGEDEPADEPEPTPEAPDEEPEPALNDIEAAAREELAEDTQPSGPPEEEREEPDEQTTEAASKQEDEITVPMTGGVARVLAKELREGNVDPGDRRAIKEELAGEESTDARISHLQSEVSDLRAYTDALEAFLDEHGTGQQLLEEVDSRTDSLESTVAELETAIESTSESVASVESSVESVESDVQSLQASVNDIESLRDRIDQLESTVNTVESQLDEMAAFRDRLASAFGESMGE